MPTHSAASAAAASVTSADSGDAAGGSIHPAPLQAWQWHLVGVVDAGVAGAAVHAVESHPARQLKVPRLQGRCWVSKENSSGALAGSHTSLAAVP